MIYLIGSLRNPAIPQIAAQLRAAGYEVFDDWYAAGPVADDAWRDYEQARGHGLAEALRGHAARHVFEFDRYHLDRADSVVLVCPAGKSGHLELGWALGRGKPGYVLLAGEPDRYDVMYAFADGVARGVPELLRLLEGSIGMSYGAISSDDLVCPSGCGWMYPMQGMTAYVCPTCRWGVSQLEVFALLDGALGQAIAQRTIGAYYAEDDHESTPAG